MAIVTEVPAQGNCLEKYVSARNIVVLLGFTGFSIIQGLMMHFPMTLTIQSRRSNPEVLNDEQFAITYSSYFCGYLLASQLLGFFRSHRFEYSPKWVILFGVLINVICTLFIPLAFYSFYFVVAFLRFNMGVGAGVVLPALKVMLSKWTLPEERNRTRNLEHTSTLLGFFIAILTSGVIGDSADWYFVFYIMGGLSLIWCVLWTLWVQDTPQKQPFISAEERNTIVTALEKEEYDPYENIPIPWREVLTSKPFMATLFAFVSCNWGFFMLMFHLPRFMHHAMYYPIMQVSLIISFAVLGMWFVFMGLIKLLKWMQQNNKCTALDARKMATACATGIPSLFLFITCFLYVPYNGGVVALLFLTIMSTGGMYYGFYSNYYKIAPNFADKLMDVTDTILIIVRIAVPFFIAGCAPERSFEVLYGLTTTLYMFALIIFTLFASIEEQPWNKLTDNPIFERRKFVF